MAQNALLQRHWVQLLLMNVSSALLASEDTHALTDGSGSIDPSS